MKTGGVVPHPSTECGTDGALGWMAPSWRLRSGSRWDSRMGQYL